MFGQQFDEAVARNRRRRKGLQHAQRTEPVRIGGDHLAAVGDHDFDRTTTDVDQQRAPLLEVELGADAELQQVGLLSAGNHLDLDAANLAQAIDQ